MRHLKNEFLPLPFGANSNIPTYDSTEVKMKKWEVMGNRRRHVRRLMSFGLELAPSAYKSILHPWGWEKLAPEWCLQRWNYAHLFFLKI